MQKDTMQWSMTPLHAHETFLCPATHKVFKIFRLVFRKIKVVRMLFVVHDKCLSWLKAKGTLEIFSCACNATLRAHKKKCLSWLQAYKTLLVTWRRRTEKCSEETMLDSIKVREKRESWGVSYNIPGRQNGPSKSLLFFCHTAFDTFLHLHAHTILQFFSLSSLFSKLYEKFIKLWKKIWFWVATL